MRFLSTLIALFLIGTALGGCETTSHEQIATIRQVAVTIPENLFNCPGAPKKPDFETMTDAQVADYINKLYRARGVCAHSLNTIRDYSLKAAAEIERR